MTMSLTRVVMKTVMLIELRNNLVRSQNVLTHSARNYARWAHRHPSKVYLEGSVKDEIDESSNTHEKSTYSKKEISHPLVHLSLIHI